MALSWGKKIAAGVAAVGLSALGFAALAVPAGADDGHDGAPSGSGGDVSAQSDVSNFTTVFGTDVAYAGLGTMRGDGTGTITVSGVTGTVTKVYMYWHGPTNSDDPSANATVSIGGQSVTGTNLGFSSSNCWSSTNSQAYRADVTSIVTGNGAYPLTNFLKSDADINGVELVVFYDDGNAANNRDVVIFDGNDSNQPNSFDTPGWDVTLSGINYTSGSAALELIVSDGQTFPESEVTINSQPFLAAGDLFDGNTVPAGNGDDHSGGLWDQDNYDVTSYLTPGPNTLSIQSPVGGSDCLSLVAAAIDLPAGSAPNQPPPVAPLQPVAEPIVLAPKFTG